MQTSMTPSTWVTASDVDTQPTQRTRTDVLLEFRPMVSSSDANWKAPYSARFHIGASAPRS
jgi:hypothetical protein